MNNNDAAARGALYTEDAIQVTDQGPIHGREAIQKHYADLLQKWHFSNQVRHTRSGFPSHYRDDWQ